MIKKTLKVISVSIILCEALLFLLNYPTYWSEDQLSSFNQYISPHSTIGWSLIDQENRLHNSKENKTINLTVKNGTRITPKKGNENRLLLFGDSYVMGYGLDDKDTFPWLMREKILNFDVVNRGVSGYGTCHVYNYINYLYEEKLLSDKDIILYFLNDFHESRNILSRMSVKLSPQRIKELQNFKFCNTEFDSQDRIHTYFEEVTSANVLEKNFRTYNFFKDFFYFLKSIYSQDYARTITQRLLLSIQESVQSHSSKFLVVLFDVRAENKESYEQYLRNNNIEYIDCSSIAQNYSSLRQKDGHPDENMNALFSNCLVSALAPRYRLALAQ